MNALRNVQGLSRAGAVARLTLFAAAAASPLATHVAILTGRFLPLAAALAVAQAGVAAVVLPGLLGRQRRWLPALVLLAALVWGAGRLLGRGLATTAGLSHLAVFGGLLAAFGATLLPGQVPLATRFARRLDPAYHAGMDGYTRATTWAWCLFFAGQLAASGLLLLLAPTSVWSWFVNVLDLPLVGAMFAAEYAVRRLRFRAHPHVPLPTLVRAVRAGGLG